MTQEQENSQVKKDKVGHGELKRLELDGVKSELQALGAQIPEVLIDKLGLKALSWTRLSHPYYAALRFSGNLTPEGGEPPTNASQLINSANSIIEITPSSQMAKSRNIYELTLSGVMKDTLGNPRVVALKYRKTKPYEIEEISLGITYGEIQRNMGHIPNPEPIPIALEPHSSTLYLISQSMMDYCKDFSRPTAVIRLHISTIEKILLNQSFYPLLYLKSEVPWKFGPLKVGGAKNRYLIGLNTFKGPWQVEVPATLPAVK